MKPQDHLTDELLVRSNDEELTPSQADYVEHHLLNCDCCRKRSQAFRATSDQIDFLVSLPMISDQPEHRNELKRRLQIRGAVVPEKRTARMTRIGWSVALAASIAIAFALVFPRRDPALNPHQKIVTTMADSSFEVNGEHFIALPYSNPDLPIETPHVIRMQVPVSALAEAGVIFEPVSDQMIAPDRAVLADVLLGTDGQPLGVHVLGSD